jgi:hypothetical protein
MNRKVTVLSLFIFLMAAAIGCDIVKDKVVLEGSGQTVSMTEDFVGFNRVEAGYSFDVEISQGDEYAIEIRADENFVEYLVITKRGNTLVLDLDEDFSYQFFDGVLEAVITMPELALLRLSGASEATMAGFDSADRFDAFLSGASSLQGDLGAGDILLNLSGSSELSGIYNVKNVDIASSGASEIHLAGSGADLSMDVSGNSLVDLEEFNSQDATVDVSGASEVHLNADGDVNISASGASRVIQSGAGEIGNADTSGASRVERK